MSLKRKKKSCWLYYTLHPWSENEVHPKATAECELRARGDPSQVHQDFLLKIVPPKCPMTRESSRSANTSGPIRLQVSSVGQLKLLPKYAWEENTGVTLSVSMSKCISLQETVGPHHLFEVPA